MIPGAVKREDRGRVRWLLLDRPPSNSLGAAMLDALTSEARAAAADPAVRCLLIGSTSPKYFSSGLDLEEMLASPESAGGGLFERMIAAHRVLAAVGKPTVAALEGYALLGGFILALGCDWRFAAAGTGKVALSEVRLGLSPSAPLIRLVLSLAGGAGLAKALLLQGRTLRAEEALEAGLVDEVFPAEGFMESAAREAERLAGLPPAAYAAIRREVRACLMPDENGLWERGAREFREILGGEESKEGLRARREKRKPRWE